jgi:hypothetical protein
MNRIIEKQVFFISKIDIMLVAAVIFSGFFAVWQSTYSPPLSFFGKNLSSTIQKEEVVDMHTGQLKGQSTQKVVSVKTIPLQKKQGHLSGFLGAVLPTKCDIAFTFLPTVNEILVGGDITYNVNLKNRGNTTCENASFSLYYGSNAKFASATRKPFAGNYYWVAGNMISGGEYKVSVTLKHDSSGTLDPILNEGCATANNGNDVCSENTVFINPQTSGISAPTQTDLDMADFSPISSSSPEPKAMSKQFFSSNNKELGTWVWESPTEMNKNRVADILGFASKNGVNALYVTIDDYLAVATLPDGAKKENLKKNYFESLSYLVTEANTLGINVDLVGGAKDWAIKENRWKGYALIDFAKEYNERYPNAKIRNFQYDVEPYLLNSYEKNKANVLKTFLEFIDESTIRMQDANVGFSVVIPHFYDSAQKWTPTVTYKGETKYTFSHLLSILEKKQNSAIIIMSYRNFFYGDNGTRQISETEIKEASNNGFTTKIIVAQETGNVEPDYVTFYGYSKAELFSTLEIIDKDLSSYQSFDGVAIHYIDSFLALKQ